MDCLWVWLQPKLVEMLHKDLVLPFPILWVAKLEMNAASVKIIPAPPSANVER